MMASASAAVVGSGTVGPEAITAADLPAYYVSWARQQFGAEHATEAAELLALYTKYNARHTPEMLAPETYSVGNYREADRIVLGPGSLFTSIIPNLLVPVARTPHLVVLKLLARDDATRPQDAMDLRALRKALDASEAAEVRRLAALVVERGFNRDRDLSGLADAYLSE